MKVIIKRPGKNGEIAEVEGLPEINKICGNVDSDGNGLDRANSDIRGEISRGVDMYVKADAMKYVESGANLWSQSGFVLFGNIVFAGYDEQAAGYGVCSLTDEQVQIVMDFIAKQEV